MIGIIKLGLVLITVYIILKMLFGLMTGGMPAGMWVVTW